LTSQSDLEVAYEQIITALGRPYAGVKLLIVLIMMPLNWLLETYKLYFLFKNEMTVSFNKCLRSVLSGLAFSINTPNRIGEYFGRILYLDKSNRIKGATYSILSGLSQLNITLLTGFFALLYMNYFIIYENTMTGIFELVAHKEIIWLLALICILFMAMYFFYGRVISRLLRMNIFKKLLGSFNQVYLVSSTVKSKLLFLSLIRYILFTSQYLLLLNVLGVNFEYHMGYVLISLIYLIMAIIPTIAFAELGIRGKVALYVAGNFTNQLLGLAAGTVILWFLNIIVPAIVGTFFIWKFGQIKRV
jgi:hypothetical protein